MPKIIKNNNLILYPYTCPECGRISYYTTESPLPCPYCEEEQLTCRRCGTTEGYFNGGYCAECWMQMALELQKKLECKIKKGD